MKNQNQIIVEKSNNGFTAYTNDLLGLTSFGETLQELKENFAEALELHLEGMQEDGDDIPESFKGDFELIFDMDAQQFLEHMSKRVNISYVAELTGINRSLLAQYKSGNKTPSPKRKKLIINSFKLIGKELTCID